MPILMIMIILRHALKISSAIVHLRVVMFFFPLHKRNTYMNMSHNHSKCIAYILVSAVGDVKSFTVLDPSINFFLTTCS